MTAVCTRCGQSWPRDPALEVPCPKCGAGIGVRCGEYRPSGHKAVFGLDLHHERDQAAMDAGFLKKCPGLRAGAEEVEDGQAV